MLFNTGESDITLKAEYNPEGSTLRRAQYRMLEMLDYLASVFKEIDVEWRLSDGSVLGAYRHKGFIPWDDDMDICIHEKDVKRVKKYLLTHPHPQFKLQCKETDSNFFERWMVLRDLESEYIIDSPMHNCRKYRGLQVDIFSEREGVVAPLFRFAKKVSGLNNYHLAGRIKWLPHVIWFMQTYLLHPIFNFISYCIGKRNRLAFSYGIQWFVPYSKEDVYPTVLAEFEGRKYPVPANAQRVLMSKYGNDFMNLPPKESRNWHKAKIIFL